MRALLLGHAASTLGMVAVIWFVQLVHYPLFAQVGAAGFARYEALHTQRISWIVVPLMLAEAITALVLWSGDVAWASRAERTFGAALVLALWASTFLLSVPEHGRLARGFDAASHARLVGTNWIRTVLWSLRGGLVLLWLWRALARAPMESA
ncbi:MAG TPA: hypothetical protein RMH85_05075 [Polyangiaceae bacterium LLY-WYZ-15_(1-7)]|nr:hypothetical protein [Myxococcales bacterium]MAT30155.1 hypothetical protein [Sandaracinus sp.]HJK91214.1 hypothetical protein [Polyangiaceae bacterium LLY-WYZ-15_(1-7)]MBJ73516.1 hypothetical protein [Sandaracinus sp.]HJL04790.1 hypothetical protein [Polyangiaceae bacterium LLY-WYZ-15_(1-7)]